MTQSQGAKYTIRAIFSRAVGSPGFFHGYRCSAISPSFSAVAFLQIS